MKTLMEYEDRKQEFSEVLEAALRYADFSVGKSEAKHTAQEILDFLAERNLFIRECHD